MDRKTVIDSLYPQCPVRNVLARLMDKWSLLVFYTMEQAGGPVRFNAFRKAIPDISQKMLSTTLQSLCDDGLVKREVYAEVPVRVEYELTERSRTLLPHLDGLLGWALENFDAVISDRKQNAEK